MIEIEKQQPNHIQFYMLFGIVPRSIGNSYRRKADTINVANNILKMLVEATY